MLAQQVMNGITQGSIYALVAIGFVLIFGTLNMVSFAHGETFMLGAFLGFFVLKILHLPLLAALLAAYAGGWIIGILTELLAFRTLRGATHMPPLLCHHWTFHYAQRSCRNLFWLVKTGRCLHFIPRRLR